MCRVETGAYKTSKSKTLLIKEVVLYGAIKITKLKAGLLKD